MANNTIDQLHVRNLTTSSFTPPAESVSNAQVAAGAGIAATKVQRRISSRVSQKNGAINVVHREVLVIVHGATGTLVKLYARNTTTATTTSTTINLYKNGVTILTATIVLTSVEGTVVQSTTGFTSTSLVAGDVLEAVITVSGATPGEGIVVELIHDEDPQ